jgi:3-hydroxymyristoyl/3-hydroxydecanoyl-(acyl carrier protein) dehydratase
MNPHFAAFSFVDRISELVPATRARGAFAIPADIAEFPACLVAEAIGQLAAWVAMAHLDFRGRPVAALAQQTRFHRVPRPGDMLDLEVELEGCDDEAVTYRGRATVRDALQVELVDCLGPMLPVADFDDPQALRERLALLRGPGAPPGRFGGVELPALEAAAGETGKTRSAILQVPRMAPFFGDHFPRRPVFPATLLLHAQMGLALELAREAGSRFVPTCMSNVKVRSFTPPGQPLELGAEITATAPDGMKMALTARTDDRSVATARLQFGAPEIP